MGQHARGRAPDSPRRRERSRAVSLHVCLVSRRPNGRPPAFAGCPRRAGRSTLTAFTMHGTVRVSDWGLLVASPRDLSLRRSTGAGTLTVRQAFRRARHNE
jgi:hypothetical protein